MKRLIIWLFICAAAVGVSLAMVKQQGIVQIFWPPHIQLTLSLNFVLLGLIGLFILLYILVRFFFYVFGLPAHVRQYRQEKQQKRARFFLNESIAAMLSGHYSHAVKMADKALALGESSGLAYLVGGRSAHHTGQLDKKEQWFHEAEKQSWLKNAAHVSEACLYIDAREPTLAQKAIEAIALKDRSVLAQRLLLKSLFMQENWMRLLHELPNVDQNRNKTHIQVWKHAALHRLLSDEALDDEQLVQYWQMISKSDQSDSMIVSAFVRCAIQIKSYVFARQVLENYLNHQWDSELVLLYGTFITEDDTSQIDCAETWLKSHSDDANLLCAIGELCVRKQLWGKARRYLEASLSITPALKTRLLLAKLLDRLQEIEAANQQYRHISMMIDAQ